MTPQMGNPAPDLVSTAEAAELLGVSISTLHRWREAGRLPAVRKLSSATGVYLFLRSEVEALASQLAPAGGDAA